MAYTRVIHPSSPMSLNEKIAKAKTKKEKRAKAEKRMRDGLIDLRTDGPSDTDADN